MVPEAEVEFDAAAAYPSPEDREDREDQPRSTTLSPKSASSEESDLQRGTKKRGVWKN